MKKLKYHPKMKCVFLICFCRSEHEGMARNADKKIHAKNNHNQDMKITL